MIGLYLFAYTLPTISAAQTTRINASSTAAFFLLMAVFALFFMKTLSFSFVFFGGLPRPSAILPHCGPMFLS